MNRHERRKAASILGANGEPMNQPKPPMVAVMFPTRDEVKADFMFHALGAVTFAMQRVPLAIRSFKGSSVAHSRNQLVRMALEANADYVVMIDSDMIFPQETILRLVGQDKDIIGAFYRKRVPPFELLGHLMEPDQFGKPGVVEAEFLPGGMLCVKTEVFRAIGAPWFFETYDEPDPANTFMSEDYNFCRKARQHGYKVWADLDLSYAIRHIGENAVPTFIAQGKPAEQPVQEPAAA